MKRAVVATCCLAAIVAAALTIRAALPTYRSAQRGREALAELQRRAAEVSPEWRRDVQLVLEDKALWQLLAPPRERDASIYLSRYVPFDGEPIADTALPAMPERIERALFDDDFFLQLDELDVDVVDTSWMQPLTTYTHWDLEAPSSPRAKRPDEPLLMMPSPRFQPLIDVARVRLAQGVIEDDMAAASAEVRALARLLWSTEEMFPAMIAIVLLKHDAEARAIAKELGGTIEGEDFPSLPKLEKVAWSSTMLFNVGTPSILRAHEKTDLVFCPAITEGASMFLIARSLYAPAFREREQAIDEAIKHSPCALTRVRRQWQSGGGEIALGGLEKPSIFAVMMRGWMRDMLLSTTLPGAQGYFAPEGNAHDGNAPDG